LDKIVKIFPSPNELAMNFAEKMASMIARSSKNAEPFTIVLSGGTTPELLFKVLSENFAESVPWKFVHFFWGDERCVPPDNDESNYGMAQRKFLSRIEIPSGNIHRIRGEDDPENEAARYSIEILSSVRNRDRLPLFDLVILGLGEDGHTASIFPGHSELFDSDKICEVALHPVTGQKRITLTGRVINNADNVTFLVTGKTKAEIVENMFKKDSSVINFPASFIVPVYGKLNWYIDHDAGILI
jgi:6-phosphogluconolactonase